MNCRTVEAIALSSRKSSPSASRQAVSKSREMHLTDHAIYWGVNSKLIGELECLVLGL